MRIARSAPVASAPLSVCSASFGPSVTTTTSPRRCFGALPFSVRRSAASSAYSSNGFGFHSSPVVSTAAPEAAILILFALSGSATRLMATRIFTGRDLRLRGPRIQAKNAGALPIVTDFLVLGSGIAGLTFALRAARHGEVVICTKRQPKDAATSFAQGGVAAVLSPADSF